MASNSKCPKCESPRFETAEEEPKNSPRRLLFVRCMDCGTVVGVVEVKDIANLMKPLLRNAGMGA